MSILLKKIIIENLEVKLVDLSTLEKGTTINTHKRAKLKRKKKQDLDGFCALSCFEFGTLFKQTGYIYNKLILGVLSALIS
jgi:hypothetical protein